MNAYCPDCETELDQNTGICPACRWDPLMASSRQAAESVQPEMSLTEKYRGSQYDSYTPTITADAGVSRGRAFVIMGLVAAAAVYGVVLALMGPF